MDKKTINYLHDLHFITPEQREHLSRMFSNEVFSLHDELRVLLFAGVLLMIGGAALFALNTINTIGPQLIILLMIVVMSACFVYVMTTRLPYSHAARSGPGFLYDAALVLGCLLIPAVMVYAEYHYALFGEGLEFLPLIAAVILLPLAYRFDSRVVLTVGVVALAASIGLAVAPPALVRKFGVPAIELIAVSVAFGSLLVVVGFATQFGTIKRHFASTYLHLGAHFLFAPALAGIFLRAEKLLFLLLLCFVGGVGTFHAKRTHSFAMMVVVAIYLYVGVSYLVSTVLPERTVQSIYVFVSCSAVVIGLFLFKRTMNEM
jgi:hypothetical protein